MGCLDIRLFGNLGLSRAGETLQSFPTRESETLFSFLVLNRNRQFPRDVLVDKLYADEPEAIGRKRLRMAIWRIRTVLEPTGIAPGTYLTNHNQAVGFNTDCDYWLDVQEFEAQLETVSNQIAEDFTPEQVVSLNNAVQLYRGDLLEGHYSDWCLWQQERLKLLLLSAIEKLMNHFAAKSDWDLAILQAHKLLNNDPLREHIHRDLMRFYYYFGDRPAALSQYDSCTRLLKVELDIEPMQETTNLRNEIISECGLQHNLQRSSRKLGRGQKYINEFDSEFDLEQLDEAADHLDEAREILKQGILKAKLRRNRPN